MVSNYYAPLAQLGVKNPIKKEDKTLKRPLSQVAKDLLSQRAPVRDQSLNPLIGRTKVGFQTLKITEEELLTTYDFWGVLIEQGVKKLIIQTKEGSITYREPVLRGLKLLRPKLEDLTEKVTLKFLDGRFLETKAKLRLCGDLFKELFAAFDTSKIPLSFSKKSFLSILKAVKLGSYFKTDFPKETLRFKGEYSWAILRSLMPVPIVEKNTDIAKYLLFPPQAMLISHPHIFGQDHYEKFWGKIGPVPPLPQELLTFLNGSCPITKDGRKVIDTHKVFWIPKMVDGQPLTINRIQEIATSDKFGVNKLGADASWSVFRDWIGNLPVEGGCWVAVGPPLEETRWLSYALQTQILRAKYPGYGIMSAGHAIISCLAPFAASGEIILGRGWFYSSFTGCSEGVGKRQVCVGGLSRSGLKASLYHYEADVLVVPARKFYM